MDITLRQAAALFAAHQSFVLTTHVNPDGDALGSILALSHCLTGQGKAVALLIDDDVPATYHFLPGCETIRKPEGAVAAELLVVLDASDRERIGRVGACVNAPVLNIDHHISNVGFADFTYLDGAAAATGEILYDLFRMMEIRLAPAAALCLYTAIASDCGFFRYANTSAATMRYASELIACGVKPQMVSERLEEKPLTTILALRRALDTLEVHCCGRAASMTVRPEALALSENTEGFVDYPRVVEGVEVAILFKCVDADVCRVSLRSKNADVSRIALAFGGGGHRRAAGCTLHGDFAAARRRVLEAVRVLLEDAHE